MDILIESAGDHKFDIRHLCQSGAENLIRFLLVQAGYRRNLLWRVRVNEKQPCSGVTAPLSVIRYNEWGVYVRIKPGDNNTCHNVTILVPQSLGVRTDILFNKLKVIEKSFNRDWQKTDIIPKIITTPNGLSEATVKLLKDQFSISERIYDIEEEIPTLKESRADSIRRLGPAIKDIFQVSTRLQEIHDQKMALQEKLHVLVKEEEEICNLLDEGKTGRIISILIKKVENAL